MFAETGLRGLTLEADSKLGDMAEKSKRFISLRNAIGGSILSLLIGIGIYVYMQPRSFHDFWQLDNGQIWKYARKGNSTAASVLASKLEGEADSRLLIELWETAAKADPAENGKIGELYHNGRADLIPDYERAKLYYEMCDCELGYFGLGEIYARGLGVGKDFNSSLANYTKAGTAEANFEIAMLYNDGLIVERDEKKRDEYLKAASKEDLSLRPDMILKIGDMFFAGDRLPQDMQKGLQYYFRIAQRSRNSLGDPPKESVEAQFKLGNAYFFGWGVAKNIMLAHMWFDVAASNGHKEAEGMRTLMSATMTEDEVIKARQLASKCAEYSECEGEPE